MLIFLRVLIFLRLLNLFKRVIDSFKELTFQRVLTYQSLTLTIVSAKINHIFTNSTIRSRFIARLRIFIFWTLGTDGLTFWRVLIFSMISLKKERKAVLVFLTLACWKETLDLASWIIYTVIVVETDYRTSSLKSRERNRQLSQSAVLHFYTPWLLDNC